MKSRRIFQYIWRINAIIILLAGSLAALSLTGSGLYLLLQATRTREVSDVINIAKEEPTKVKTEVGIFSPIAGTDILKAPLYLLQEYDYRAGSKESSSIQNYLFFDSNQKKFSWLRPQNQGLILSMLTLPEVTNIQPLSSSAETNTNLKQPAIAHLYVIADKDTNNDKRIDDRDQKQIAISNPAGTNFKILVEQVERFNGLSALKDNQVSLIYISGGKIKATVIDVRSQEILGNTEFSAQP